MSEQTRQRRFRESGLVRESKNINKLGYKEHEDAMQHKFVSDALINWSAMVDNNNKVKTIGDKSQKANND